MQPNLKIECGSKEPQGNVDIQFKHGKNLYIEQDIKNGLWISGSTVGSNSSGWYVVLPIKGGNTYTISRKNGKTNNSALTLAALTTNEFPVNGSTVVDAWINDATNARQVTIQTSANANYLFVGLVAGNTTEVTKEIQALAVEELQVEIGDSATEYEPHVENDILVKVNGGYISMFSELRESIKK